MTPRCVTFGMVGHPSRCRDCDGIAAIARLEQAEALLRRWRQQHDGRLGHDLCFPGPTLVPDTDAFLASEPKAQKPQVGERLQTAECASWCGKAESFHVQDRAEVFFRGDGTYGFCTAACRASGHPLHPITPQTPPPENLFGRDASVALSAGPLTLEKFSAMNRRRCESHHGFSESLQPDSKYTLLAWACSIASEAGEVCDAVVGYEGLKERRSGKTREDIADELADVITYSDLAIQKLGLWTPDVLVKKFHAVNARLEEKDPHCGAVRRFSLATSQPPKAAVKESASPSVPTCPTCECCKEAKPDAIRRDGTGDPDAVLCDDCHGEFKRNDVEPQQW